MSARTVIVICKGCDGRYTYCPDAAYTLLRPHLLPGDFDTANAAMVAAKGDQTIPAGARFKVLPCA